ncbi:hypothetical protein HMPREF0542_11545 [Ligilactobacillus ruminis ATCC 25644]|uniref:Uncharacterized protein n=1 Tax=Ligilactobacillus ruminis ATCC 25644 TaxID=525362 RepID=E7FRL8_9LACO|nr:hypothetical protein HMPREF0542_11545 [Ligilactobacillus ruminis ATCC 25644]
MLIEKSARLLRFGCKKRFNLFEINQIYGFLAMITALYYN